MGPYYELAKVLGVEAGLVGVGKSPQPSGRDRSVVWSTADTARPPEGPHCFADMSSRYENARRPSSGNSYADVEAAYDYLVEKRGLPPKRSQGKMQKKLGHNKFCLLCRIVAYGQSVGRRTPQSEQPGIPPLGPSGLKLCRQCRCTALAQWPGHIPGLKEEPGWLHPPLVWKPGWVERVGGRGAGDIRGACVGECD